MQSMFELLYSASGTCDSVSTERSRVPELNVWPGRAALNEDRAETFAETPATRNQRDREKRLKVAEQVPLENVSFKRSGALLFRWLPSRLAFYFTMAHSAAAGDALAGLGWGTLTRAG